MKQQLPQEAIEFLPDALEIKNQRLPLLVQLCVWVPLAVLVLAIAWACIAKVDVVVQGNSKLVTDLPTIVMKPLERSVIESIDVKIGDIVKKDQVLITFDPAINVAEAERLKNEIMALSAQLNRLKAEFNGKPYTESANQFQKWQYAIYKQRQNYYQERMNYFKETFSQIDASSKSRRDSLHKQRERLAAMQTLEDMFAKLHKNKAVSLKELIQLQISRMEMESVVDELENNLLELNHRRGSSMAEKNAFVQEWRNSIAENMVKVDLEYTATKKSYAKIAQLIEYVCLRAPCEAVVHEIASFSPGSAVREAEALITLIPLDGNIELEAEIRPQDIGKVKTGAVARVKLSAYPFQKHGTLKGVVRNISENTLDKDMGGHRVSYYRARVAISGELHGIDGKLRLIPGMEAQCEIKTGRRRVIEYVLYPLIKALDETATEP